VGDFYPEKISERFGDPKNVGSAQDANAKGKWASFVCGVSIAFSVRIESETKEIADAKFKTNGCGFVIATADLIAEKIVGQKLTDLQGLENLANSVCKELDEIPDSRQHCLDICFDALQNALGDYRTSLIEEWSGEKALICTCFGVSEETIENLVATKGIKTVEDVGENCSAGTGCGSCQLLIQEILDASFSDF